jgi:hypothetical protein
LFGLVVDPFGADGVAGVHAALGLVAAAAWIFNLVGAGPLPGRRHPNGHEVAPGGSEGQRTK